VTAEDVGTTVEDMDFVHMETTHVAGIGSKSGDPSSVTARGVFRAIQASAFQRWGSKELTGRTVAIQGLGSVGSHLARELHRAGADLVVTDIDATRVDRVVKEFGATAVPLDDIYAARADIFAPCALGGILNDDTIPRLQVEIVSGAANNQLLEDRHGDELEARGVLYAPDYVANAGGVINVYSELTGWSRDRSLRKADEIYETVLSVFALAKSTGIPTYMAADRVAEQRIAAVRGMMRTWPQYPNKES
jgi:leucine dehydrogenase